MIAAGAAAITSAFLGPSSSSLAGLLKNLSSGLGILMILLSPAYLLRFRKGIMVGSAVTLIGIVIQVLLLVSETNYPVLAALILMLAGLLAGVRLLMVGGKKGSRPSPYDYPVFG